MQLFSNDASLLHALRKFAQLTRKVGPSVVARNSPSQHAQVLVQDHTLHAVRYLSDLNPACMVGDEVAAGQVEVPLPGLSGVLPGLQRCWG